MKAISSWKLINIKSLLCFAAIVLCSMWAASCSEEPEPAFNNVSQLSKGKTATFDAPAITCVDATQVAITVKVKAGASGAPAGFSLQWISKTVLDANNGVWPSDETLFCKAGFSGNANGYVFNLPANGEAVVTVGDVLYDTPGASSECIADLLCGTEYVFRAFAHATSTVFKSAWSANQVCSTDACVNDCVYGVGYWKNHGSLGTASEPVKDEFGNITGYLSVWPVASLALGNNTYTEAQLINILKTSAAGGNNLLMLAKELIAAKLNIANGADGSSIASIIAAADALISDYVLPEASLKSDEANVLKDTLKEFNEPADGDVYCK